MASPSYTYSLTNGTTADATQVMQDFNDILNGVTDGSKDLSINALTVAGTAMLNGAINLGNASADDITITGSLASSFPIKTNNTYDFGSATLGLRKLYLGNAGLGATCDIVAASHATTREYTIPDCGAAASFAMTQGTQTISGTKTFDGQLIGKGTTTNDNAASTYIGEYLEGAVTTDTSVGTSGQFFDAGTITLTAGDWDVTGVFYLDRAGATFTSTDFELGIWAATGNSSTGLKKAQNFIAEAGLVIPTTFSTTVLYTPKVRVQSDGTNLYFQGTTASSTQIIRLKPLVSVYTVGTPTYQSYIRARRVR